MDDITRKQLKEWLGEENQIGIDIWEKKYRYNNESFDGVILTDKEDEKDTTSTTVKETEESNSDFCFVTASGTKYHKDGCSYLKKSKTKMTVDEAKRSGYSPCSRCY